MTTFTTIPNSSLEPGKPIRSIDGLALRDNPIAMFEGDASAPKLAAAGLQTGTNERDWVLARTAAAAVGAVGTYAFLSRESSGLLPGATSAGSSLFYAGTALSSALSTTGGGSPSGTWRLMGYTRSFFTVGYDAFDARISLWLRIS